MGCVSTKLHKTQQPNPDSLFDNADFGAARHIVSLTSTTYGFLKLDSSLEHRRTPFRDERTELPNPPHIDRGVYDPEIINAWELMRDLDDEFGFSKSPKLMNSTTSSTSSKKQRRFSGKENKPRMVEFESRSAGAAAAQHVSKPFTSIENNLQKVPNYLKQISIKSSTVPLDVKIDSFRSDTAFLTPKQGFSPLFDPELLTSFEIELDEEREQIKNMVSPPPEKSKHGETECTLLELFEKKTPPPLGGENVVVMYTTTLRGIRKTYEDCNRLRSLIESHDVYTIERDVSMDSGFREELRALMGGESSEIIRLPVVFVKGRLIGGVEELVKIEEEGKLGGLFGGIPKSQVLCGECCGVRFLMCVECSGSCRVIDEEKNQMVRCHKCNENGLIQCPFCCSLTTIVDS